MQTEGSCPFLMKMDITLLRFHFDGLFLWFVVYMKFVHNLVGFCCAGRVITCGT